MTVRDDILYPCRSNGMADAFNACFNLFLSSLTQYLPTNVLQTNIVGCAMAADDRGPKESIFGPGAERS